MHTYSYFCIHSTGTLPIGFLRKVQTCEFFEITKVVKLKNCIFQQSHLSTIITVTISLLMVSDYFNNIKSYYSPIINGHLGKVKTFDDPMCSKCPISFVSFILSILNSSFIIILQGLTLFCCVISWLDLWSQGVYYQSRPSNEQKAKAQ